MFQESKLIKMFQEAHHESQYPKHVTTSLGRIFSFFLFLSFRVIYYMKRNRVAGVKLPNEG